MSHISEYLNRARYIRNNEGSRSLIKRALSYLSLYIFFTEEYYVREHYYGDLKESDFLPKIKDCTIEIVSVNDAADALAERRGTDFRDHILNARRHLDSGAVAFCVFVKNEFASVVWSGIRQKAQDSIDSQPYFTDFSRHQGFTSGAETTLKYRGNGLMAYACYHRNNFMKEQGIRTLIGIDATDNIAIYKVQSKFPSRLCGRARYTKILWWKFWKETPLPDGFVPPGFNS